MTPTRRTVLGGAVALAAASTVTAPGRIAYSYISNGTLHSQGKPSRVAVQPGGFTVVLG